MTIFPISVVHDGSCWRARPDGELASARLLSWCANGAEPPAGFRCTLGGPIAIADATERAIDVDQTNRSVIVGEVAVVKWPTGALVGPQPGPERLRRLMAAGFDRMPTVLALVEWRTPEGHWVPVATAQQYIAGAVDGWTWCVHEARVALGLASGPARPFATTLGELAASMHRALAVPGSKLVAPHGDFHVGQILRDAAGKLYVIDFDGNPTLAPEDRVTHRPAAYDVAHMLLSLENVGHVLRHHHPDVTDHAAVEWTERVQREFLAAYRSLAGDLLDEAALPTLIEAQIEREFAYARDHLPEWRYVPEAALDRRAR